jgi:hypothetical protein
MCIVFSEFPSTKDSLPKKDEKFTAEQNVNLLVCSSQKICFSVSLLFSLFQMYSNKITLRVTKVKHKSFLVLRLSPCC